MIHPNLAFFSDKREERMIRMQTEVPTGCDLFEVERARASLVVPGLLRTRG